jgi:hypothetical protein
MVLRMTGTRWLALMMQAERAGGEDRPDSEWLMYGPSEEEDDSEIIAGE